MAPSTTRYVLVPAILTPFAVMVQFGYSVGSINSLSGPLQAFYNSTLMQISSTPEYHLNTLWPLTASMLPLGGIIGSFLVKPLEIQFGKRNTLVYIQVLVAVSVVLNSISKVSQTFITLLCGHFIMGIYVGIGIGIGPMYVAEISPKHLRGTVGGLFSVFISFGVLVGNVLGLPNVFGNDENWAYQFICAMFPSIIFIASLPYLPQSPRNVFIMEKNVEKTKKILQLLRGRYNVDNEMRELEHEVENLTHSKSMSLLQVVRSPSVRWQTISAVVILATSQLSGFNGLQYNLNDIFDQANIPNNIVPYITLGLLIFQCLFSVFMGFLTDRIGRKTLLVVGNSTMCFSWTAFTVCLRYDNVEWVSYMTTVCAFGVIVGFCIGPGPATYSISPELFDQTSRSAAISFGVFFLWASLVIVAYVTPLLQTALDYLAFVPYAVISFCTAAYIFWVVPETKGRTFTEIKQKFDKFNRVSRQPRVYSIPNPYFESEK